MLRTFPKWALALGLALMLAVGLRSTVGAQTATPTRTPTRTATPTATNTPNTTPTPLVTPTTSPNNFGVWWACTQFDGATAWACEPVSNGVFVFEQYLSQSGIGFANSEQYYSIHAPTSIYSATLLCGYTAEHAGGPHTVHNATTQSTGSAIINRSGNWSATDATGSTLYRAYRGTNTTSQNEWGTYVWGFPTTGTAARTHIWGLRSYISVTGYGSGTTLETASGGTLIHCQVERYMLYTGEHHNWHDESTPTPTVTTTPTPAPTGTPTPGGLVYHVTPWAVPTPAHWEFEVGTPSAASCYAILPAFSFGDWTILGFTIPLVGIPEFEICVQEYNFAMDIFGQNVGALLITLVTLGAASVIYRLVKGG